MPQSLLDMMVAEEENLKERLLKSIAMCRKELDTLCRELQLEPFEVRQGLRSWGAPGDGLLLPGLCPPVSGAQSSPVPRRPLPTRGGAGGVAAPRRPGAGRWL